MNYLHLCWLRLSAKSPRRLVRAILIRAWPLSLLVRGYYRLRESQWWRGIVNRRATVAFLVEPPKLDSEQQRCIASLREDGVCRTSVDRLFGDIELFDRLKLEVADLLAQPLVRNQIDNRRATNNPKWYVIRALGYGTHIELPPTLAELLVHPRILGVVNQYLGMYSRLGYADVWYNLPVKEGEPGIDSESWHRDHEDRSIVKVYCYIDSVEEQTGPLNYLRGTQPGGRFAAFFPRQPSLGVYPPVEKVDATIPPTAREVCTGAPGTVLFCDTTGLHRGGRAIGKPRVLITATYFSNAGLDRRKIVLTDPVAKHDQAARFALGRAR